MDEILHARQFRKIWKQHIAQISSNVTGKNDTYSLI